MKADRAKTVAQHYLDWRSYMRLDGSEVLYGEDWNARKAQLNERSGGRCEQQIRLDRLVAGDGRCCAESDDPHHIVRRSVRRDDRLSNLQALCRFHHDLLDKRKIRSDKRERRANAQQS